MFKVVCIDSTDPENLVETIEQDGFADEGPACTHRDLLRAENDGKSTTLWFEVRASCTPQLITRQPDDSPPDDSPRE